MAPAVLFFFEKDPAVLPIYEAFEARTLAEVENVSIRVQKTQITFTNPRVFAAVSFPVSYTHLTLPTKRT